MTDYVLQSWGRSTWADTFDRVQGHTWLWCDLVQAQLEDALPQQFPRSTHVWGWAVGSWIRLRLDSSELVVGARLLTAGPGIPGTAVAVTVTDGRTWQQDERRVSVVEKVRGKSMTRLVAHGPSPLTFLALGEAN